MSRSLEKSTSNPATNVRRVVFLTQREVLNGENQALNSMLNKTDLQRMNWSEDFSGRNTEDLANKIEQDAQGNPNTAYVIFSDSCDAGTTATTALATSNIGAPLLIVQLRNRTPGEVSHIDVFYQNKSFRYSHQKAGAQQNR